MTKDEMTKRAPAPRSRFGALFRKTREAVGPGFAELVLLAGVKSSGTVSNGESGHRPLSAQLAHRLVQALRATPKRKRLLLKLHAMESKMLDVSGLDEIGLQRVVRVLDNERRRIAG